MIHPNSCHISNKFSPLGEMPEGQGVPMAHDEAYYQAEKKIEEALAFRSNKTRPQ